MELIINSHGLANMTPIEYKQNLSNKNPNFDVNLLTVKKWGWGH